MEQLARVARQAGDVGGVSAEGWRWDRLSQYSRRPADQGDLLDGIRWRPPARQRLSPSHTKGRMPKQRLLPAQLLDPGHVCEFGIGPSS